MKRQACASDRDSSEQKNHSNKSAQFVARNVLPSTDSSMQRCNNTSGFRGFSLGSEYTSFPFGFKIYPLAVLNNHLRRNGD